MPSDLISISFHHKCVYHHSTVYLWTLCNIAVGRIFVKIPASVFYVDTWIIFKYSGNIFVEVDPVFPVQEEYTDTDQVGHVFVIIAPVQIFEFLRIFFSFSYDLL